MKKILSALICSSLLLLACDKYISSIPDADVYIKRNFSSFSILNSFGGYLYIAKPVYAVDRIGFGGILIVHAQDDNFYAVDLACPHEVDVNHKVSPPDDSGICKCPTCGEEYNMTFGQGNPTKKISKESLKHYRVTLDDSNNIIVTR